jgi:hypothetical protein
MDTSATVNSFIVFCSLQKIYCIFYGWHHGLEPSMVFQPYPIYAASLWQDYSAPISSGKAICMHFYNWTISFCGVLAGLEIVYNSIVSLQRCSFVQMHEKEEVALSTSSRKRRYKTSFRYSTMKELKRTRESKKKAIGIV